MSDHAQTALIFIVVFLLVVVGLVGLFNGELDPTTAFGAVCVLLGGIFTTLRYRPRPPDDAKHDHPDGSDRP